VKGIDDGKVDCDWWKVGAKRRRLVPAVACALRQLIAADSERMRSGC